MELHNIGPTIIRQPRKRVGRGDGSGHGGTAGRGHKGQHSRSGVSSRPHFEGGQITFFRRLPKRGFKSLNPVQFHEVNVSLLEANFESGAVIDEAILSERGLIQKAKKSLKILANGELTKSFTVKANKFTAAAQAKIEACGGKCEIVK